MKVKNLTPAPKELFEPITIEIIIESRDELMNLHQRLNMAHDSVVKSRGNHNYFPDHNRCSKELFFLIDNIADERGAKRC